MTAMTSRTDTPSRAYDAPRAPRAAGAIRLTRRGQVLLVALLAGLLLAAFSLGRADSQAATSTEPRAALATTTVHAGDTLWKVAQRVAPDNDPRTVIAQIEELNDLDGKPLRVGQQLLLPRSA